jgi:hypothetical protein
MSSHCHLRFLFQTYNRWFQLTDSCFRFLWTLPWNWTQHRHFCPNNWFHNLTNPGRLIQIWYLSSIAMYLLKQQRNQQTDDIITFNCLTDVAVKHHMTYIWARGGSRNFRTFVNFVSCWHPWRGGWEVGAHLLSVYGGCKLFVVRTTADAIVLSRYCSVASLSGVLFYSSACSFNK